MRVAADPHSFLDHGMAGVYPTSHTTMRLRTEGTEMLDETVSEDTTFGAYKDIIHPIPPDICTSGLSLQPSPPLACL